MVNVGPRERSPKTGHILVPRWMARRILDLAQDQIEHGMDPDADLAESMAYVRRKLDG